MLPFCERLDCKDGFEIARANTLRVRKISMSGLIAVMEEGLQPKDNPIEMPIQMYSVRSNKWIAMEKIPELVDLYDYGLQLVDRQLFIFGGCADASYNPSDKVNW